MNADQVEVTLIAVGYFGVLILLGAVGVRAVLTDSVPAWTMWRRKYTVAAGVARLYGWSFTGIALAGILMGAAAAYNIVRGGAGRATLAVVMPIAMVLVLAGVGMLFYATWRRDRTAPESRNP